MSIKGVAQKSNNIKKWTQRFLLTSIIQGAIAVSIIIMLAAFVISTPYTGYLILSIIENGSVKLRILNYIFCKINCFCKLLYR